jgi:hypothetical protein
MEPTLRLHPSPKGWLLDSVLAAHVDAFVAYLRLRRYARSTTNRYLVCIAHFARWMDLSGLAVERVDDVAVNRFLTDHLPGCNCPAPVARVHRDLRAGCGHLLQVLRERGVVTAPVVATGPIADELRNFDEYMRGVRGLADKTRSARVRVVRRLLLQRFADRPVVIAQLQPADVRRFIADQLDHRRTASNASALAAALRAYLRYRTMCGDRVHALARIGWACCPHCGQGDFVPTASIPIPPRPAFQARGPP